MWSSPSWSTSGKGTAQHLQESGPIGMHSLLQSTHGYFHLSLATRWREHPTSYKHIQFLWHGSPSVAHDDKWKRRAHIWEKLLEMTQFIFSCMQSEMLCIRLKKRKKKTPNQMVYYCRAIQTYGFNLVTTWTKLNWRSISLFLLALSCLILKGKQTLLNPNLEGELGKFH